MREKINLAVLISGRGSNLKAIIDAIKNGYLDKVNLRVVIANKDAPGLRYVKEIGSPYHTIHRIINGEKIPNEEHDKKVMKAIERYDIDLIALAGYNQVLQKEFVNRYKWKIMNIHPSLLPSFGGTLHGQKDALEYGVKISGCTVHFVEEDIDTGPIIIQAAVPVKDDDTSETLANRILEHEYIIYPKAIKLFSENRLKIVGRKVIVEEELKTSFIIDPEYHMKRIGVTEDAIKYLLEKCRIYTVLVENITPREAMILKQEMLSIGGDCAVPKECILNNLMLTDAILIGNSIQLKILIEKLKQQVFNLSKLGEELEMLIRTMGEKEI
ncbi:MAG: phosphoribosylglycinamide formyltransferase [Candidatus Altiarchaeales archaeon WOR_SM1_79]|nr:MAG: phosphoribosylglycinamide formyltransferase [Candidatus Altiarchaeales archaeon WOR_SM1_79]